MDTCKNCGKPLENPDQELCPACRAVENAKARTRREEKAGHARRRRMNRTTRKMLIAVCVLAVVFTGLCVTATVMYDKYNPDEFIASVDAALEAGDARALKNLLKGEDLTVSDEGAAALCRAFTDAAQREALRGQLEDQVVDGGAQGAFPALGVEKESVFFGYSRYSLTVHSVRLLLSSPVQNLRLSLDGVPRTGEQTADGILYQNLFPGLYTCTVTGTGDAKSLKLIRRLHREHPEAKIIVIDSLSACRGQGMLIYRTVRERREKNLDIEALADFVRGTIQHQDHWFMVDDLNHLKRGGRVSAAAALAGTVLGIKPVMHTDSEGKLTPVSKARGSKGALRALVDKMEELGIEPEKNQPVFICHANCPDYVAYVKELLKERFNVTDVRADFIGPVIGAHTGCGTLGLFFVGTKR